MNLPCRVYGPCIFRYLNLDIDDGRVCVDLSPNQEAVLFSSVFTQPARSKYQESLGQKGAGRKLLYKSTLLLWPACFFMRTSFGSTVSYAVLIQIVLWCQWLADRGSGILVESSIMSYIACFSEWVWFVISIQNYSMIILYYVDRLESWNNSGWCSTCPPIYLRVYLI